MTNTGQILTEVLLNYDKLRSGGVTRDPALWSSGMHHWTERHLQCVWYDERLRPDKLVTLGGEPLEVVEPGIWNLEAGPDFLDAQVRVGKSRKLMRGDIEIHVRPGDWRHHRHSGDPRYAGVFMHVTYYPGLHDIKTLPAHWLHVCLQESLESRRGFSFADIDLTAYPHAILPQTPRPCGESLAELTPGHWTALLNAAGLHRLREKASRISERLRVTGDRYQVFYEETLAMLGARKNTRPCRRLAETVLRGREAGFMPPEELYARLLGSAGLLPDPQRMKNAEAQKYARQLWDIWFRAGGSMEVALERRRWDLAGLRPTNHPLRRLAAGAMLFSDPCRILDALDRLSPSDPQEWIKRSTEIFASVGSPAYWEKRLGFDLPPSDKPVAILGRNRIAAILANSVIPLYLAENPEREDIALALPSEDLGSPAREAACRLFGRDHNPALYARNGLMQQGLLAIHHDFCLRVRGGCEACALSKYLQEGRLNVQ